jgi:nitrogen PTS system EIIA component
MQLTLRQAASYLDVPEAAVRRWIDARGLPVHQVNERLYCNALELWEWAVEQGIPVSPKLLEQARRTPEEVPPISSLLVTGGIHRDLDGATKRDVLHALVGALPLPPDVDREFLVSVLEAREALGSTGIGDGIAIPHVRNPILLHVTQPFVALALLKRPVDFDALDGQPVNALFLVVSPTVPTHLRILARLGALLRDQELRRLLRANAPTETLRERIAALERTESGGNHGSSSASPLASTASP